MCQKAETACCVASSPICPGLPQCCDNSLEHQPLQVSSSWGTYLRSFRSNCLSRQVHASLKHQSPAWLLSRLFLVQVPADTCPYYDTLHGNKRGNSSGLPSFSLLVIISGEGSVGLCLHMPHSQREIAHACTSSRTRALSGNVLSCAIDCRNQHQQNMTHRMCNTFRPRLPRGLYLGSP